ncbi:unnamed protein product [Adineta steineri]|uniref:Collagenase NC10/endostatin domain-containing protein n=1 Tax=Adineta steineri TaxID=433720 RepID=A0A818SRN4_9BILA|nr:unnamed protein product [Adineta steineri]
MFNLLIIIILCQGTIAFTKQISPTDPICQCEKGERGTKGDMGHCPTSCAHQYDTYSKDCLGTRFNLERLARSIRQLVIDTKVVYRDARRKSCKCPTVASTSTISNPYLLDYRMQTRLKGDKGDAGQSCPLNCMQSIQTNVRVFSTFEAAMNALFSYPDHTYVHIVSEHGHLQGVYIRIHERLIPLRLENEQTYPVQQQISSISKPKCTTTLPCRNLHIFALGPYTRKMCNPERPILCSKLSDFDDLCERVAERHHLKGFYRAFMSTSTQWLSNLFDGICMDAKIINMHEQTLFNSFKEMFQDKPAQNELLDVQGLKPQFQYWWHGSLSNGTASNDTCVDWSRQDTSLSGIASRIPDGISAIQI